MRKSSYNPGDRVEFELCIKSTRDPLGPVRLDVAGAERLVKWDPSLPGELAAIEPNQVWSITAEVPSTATPEDLKLTAGVTLINDAAKPTVRDKTPISLSIQHSACATTACAVTSP